MTKETNNIGHPARIPLTELNLYHKNPRRGDVDAIMGSMVANGIYKPLVMNVGTHTGRPNEILAGNHSLQAIRRLAELHPDDARWQTVDVWQVDVDEERATRIVLADNRTADLGSYDDEQLLELLGTVDQDLEGTGYSQDDLKIYRDLQEGAPSLDDLADEFGELEDNDLWVTIRVKVPRELNAQWSTFQRQFDSPEQAFAALLEAQGNGA